MKNKNATTWLFGFSAGLFMLISTPFINTTSAQELLVSNNPEMLWTRKSGGVGYDRSEGIVCEFDGNIYEAGSFNSASINDSEMFTNTFHGGNYDGYISKTDKDDNIIWSVFVGGSNNDFCTSAILDHEGFILITGYTTSQNIGTGSSTFGGGSRDAFCAKYDTNGNQIWLTYIGGNGDDNGSELISTSNGDIYIAGKTNSASIGYESIIQPEYGGGSSDGFIARLDTNGNLEMFSYFGGAGSDEIKDVAQNGDGQFFLCGYTSGLPMIDSITNIPYSGGSSDSFVACVNTNDGLEWGHYAGGINTDAFNAAAVDANGNVILAGSTNSGPIPFLAGSEVLSASNHEVFLVAYNNDGYMLWNKFITGSGQDIAKEIHVDLFGNIYLGGTTSSTDLQVLNPLQTNAGGNIDNFLSKWTSDGELKWLTYLGGNAMEWFGHISSDRFGKLMVSGFTFSADYGNEDVDINYGDSDSFITRISDCDNPVITIHTNDDIEFCDGGSALLTACGASSYEWHNQDTLNMTTVDTTSMCYVIGHNIEGCFGMSNKISVLSKELPETAIVALGPTTFCDHGEVILVATGAVEYTWSDELQTTSDTLFVTTGDLYSVTGIGENGCPKSAMMEVLMNELPEAIMSAAQDSICISGAPINLIGLPLGGYFSGDGVIGNEFHPFEAGGGVHEVTYNIVDENGCEGSSAPVAIEVFYYPTVLFVGVDTLCTFDDALQLSATPAGGTFSGDGVIDDVFYPNLPGTGPQNITYTFVDARGCINFDSDIIYVDPCIVAETEEISLEEITVYPNPATDHFIVINPDPNTFQTTLIESNGRTVGVQSGKNNIRVETAHLSAGIYFLKVSSAQNARTFQIVITK
jgi:Secretion system C-terminal sorting domain